MHKFVKKENYLLKWWLSNSTYDKTSLSMMSKINIVTLRQMAYGYCMPSKDQAMALHEAQKSINSINNRAKVLSIHDILSYYL